MRRGDHVVRGEVKVTPPSNFGISAKKRADNEYLFHDRAAAEKYAAANPLKTQVRKVWVNEDTGAIHEADIDTGELRKVLASDDDSVPRFIATVDNKHVEFVQGHGAAGEAAWLSWLLRGAFT